MRRALCRGAVLLGSTVGRTVVHRKAVHRRALHRTPLPARLSPREAWLTRTPPAVARKRVRFRQLATVGKVTDRPSTVRPARGTPRSTRP